MRVFLDTDGGGKQLTLTLNQTQASGLVFRDVGSTSVPGMATGISLSFHRMILPMDKSRFT